MLEIQLNLISAVAIFLAAVVPVYLTLRLQGNLRKLTLLLSVFILTHAIFHITGFLGFNFLAEGVFEPISVAVLIFFGVLLWLRFFYSERSGKKIVEDLDANLR